MDKRIFTLIDTLLNHEVALGKSLIYLFGETLSLHTVEFR